MKILKNIIAILLTCTAAFSVACNKEDGHDSRKTGIIVSPENLSYDGASSSDAMITLVWDASKPLNALANSFTVQLVKVTDDKADEPEGTISRTIKAYAPRRTDSYTFKKLEKYARYYARVRAEYDSGNSEWVYLTLGENPAVIEVGKGVIEGGISSILTPTARLLNASAGNVSIAWSVTDFKECPLDLRQNYEIALYKDAACSDLEVSWVIKASDGLFTGFPLVTLNDPTSPAFIFTGLEASKDYWFKVKNITDSSNIQVSDMLKVSTLGSRKVTVGDTKVAAGDDALFEDFDELLWGSGYTTRSLGYSSTERGKLATFVKAGGDNPVGGENGYYLVDQNVEMVLFSTIKKIIPTTSLADWSAFVEEGTTVNPVCNRAGHLKLGASSCIGTVATPALTNLSDIAKLEVSFDAMPFYIREPKTVKVLVIENGTVTDYKLNAPETDVLKAASLELEPGYEMKHYSVTLPNVHPGARIAIGGDRPEGTKGQLRFSLDNVEVKVLSYGEVAVDLEAPEIVATPGVASIDVRWNRIPYATSYTVEYRLAGASEWTTSTTEATGTSHEIKELTQGKGYEIRVKAATALSASAYSEIVQIKLEEKSLWAELVTDAGQQGISPTSLIFHWKQDAGQTDEEAVTGAGYKIALYRDQACSDLVLSWNISKQSSYNEYYPTNRYIFTDLTPSTTYWFQATDLETGTSSKPVSGSTLAENAVTIGAAGSAKEGEVILFENFDEIIWTADNVDLASGYTPYNAKGQKDRSLSKLTSAVTGDNPVAKAALEEPHQNCGLATYLYTYESNAPRLADWSGWGEDDSMSRVAARANCIGLGNSKRAGGIVTPALASLAGKATIRVTAKIGCGYGGLYKKAPQNDNKKFAISTMEGGTVEKRLLKDAVKTIRYQDELPDYYRWYEYSTTIGNVTPETRICVGGVETGGAYQNRLCVDDIKIELIKYE